MAQPKRKVLPLRRRIERLLETGLTMEDVASKLDVRLSTVYRWRTDPKVRPMRVLMRSLEALERRALV